MSTVGFVKYNDKSTILTMTTSASSSSSSSTALTPATDVLVILHRYSSLRANADEGMRSSAWNIARARRCRAYQSSCVGGWGSSFSADDVREELRARALLEWNHWGGDAIDVEKEEGDGTTTTTRAEMTMTTTDDGPDLVDDDADDDADRDVCCYGSIFGGVGGGGGEKRGGEFVLHLDGMEEASRQRGGQQRGSRQRLANDKEGGGSWADEGLRRRRRGVNDAPPDDAGKRAKDDDVRNEWTSENATDVVEGGDDATAERRLRNADPLNLFGVPPPALRAAQAESRGALAYYVEVANLAMEIMRIIDGGNDLSSKPSK